MRFEQTAIIRKQIPNGRISYQVPWLDRFHCLISFGCFCSRPASRLRNDIEIVVWHGKPNRRTGDRWRGKYGPCPELSSARERPSIRLESVDSPIARARVNHCLKQPQWRRWPSLPHIAPPVICWHRVQECDTDIKMFRHRGVPLSAFLSFSLISFSGQLFIKGYRSFLHYWKHFAPLRHTPGLHRREQFTRFATAVEPTI